MNRAKLVQYAKASIDRGSKSFAAASRLFPRPVRERVWLLYAWCRECDDLVDGQDHGGPMSAVSDPVKRVAAARAFTRRAHSIGQTGKPAFDAFGVVAQECRIPLALADDMIDGFALDAREWQPETEDDLFRYCYHVAGSVGCMMAIVMGVPAEDDKTLDRACDLGIAFQLANIARDISEDAVAGRCYLPLEWLKEARISPDDILNPARREALVLLIKRLCDHADQYAASARVGADRLPFRSRWAVLSAAGIYGEIARRVKQSDGVSLDQRIVTSRTSKVGWVLKALAQSVGRSRPVDRRGLWTRDRQS